MNEFFVWSDDISVGIQEIDEQHKQLILMINQLYDTFIHPKNKGEIVKDVMNKLIQYTIIHFSVEESLFRIFEYPEYEDHKNHHTELTKQVVEINNRIQSGEAKITIELLGFLKKWLQNHIMIEDKRYSSFFLNKGMTKSWKNKSWVGKIWDSMH